MGSTSWLNQNQIFEGGFPLFLLEEGGGGIFDGNTANIILLMAGGVLLMFLMMRVSSRRLIISRQQRQLDQQRTVEPPQQNLGSTSPPRGDPEVERLYVDLQDFAREIEGRLDTKITYLRQLIKEAERTGQKLESLIEAAVGEPVLVPDDQDDDPGEPASGMSSDSSVESKSESRVEGQAKALMDQASKFSEALASAQEVATEEVAQVEEEREGKGSLESSPDVSADQGRVDQPAEDDDQSNLGKNLDITVGTDEDRPDPHRDPASEPTDPQDKIWALHQEGKTSQEIADLMNLPKGEVELMINLRQSESK